MMKVYEVLIKTTTDKEYTLMVFEASHSEALLNVAEACVEQEGIMDAKSFDIVRVGEL